VSEGGSEESDAESSIHSAQSHSMQHLLRLKASEFKKYEIDKYLYLVRV